MKIPIIINYVFRIHIQLNKNICMYSLVEMHYIKQEEFYVLLPKPKWIFMFSKNWLCEERKYEKSTKKIISHVHKNKNIMIIIITTITINYTYIMINIQQYINVWILLSTLSCHNKL